MKVNNFVPNQKKVLQVERPSQVHQLVTKTTDPKKFFNSVIRVWNNTGGEIVPPITVGQLVGLCGDEYNIQVGFDFVNSEELIVVTYEISDEGSLNPTVYVELDLTGYSDDVELDVCDVTQTTAVRVRKYNIMKAVSPILLPKNSICTMLYSEILSLQKNNDLMGQAEMLTHSNYLFEQLVRGLHPLVYDSINSTPVPCLTYDFMANGVIMGYNPSGRIAIFTGDDEFLLSPQSSGCDIIYCQKQLTKIAQQVKTALAVQGQSNNVDSSEFAECVAAVGTAAKELNKDTSQTQFLADRAVLALPSVRISRALKISDLNLSSERPKLTGLKKTL